MNQVNPPKADEAPKTFALAAAPIIPKAILDNTKRDAEQSLLGSEVPSSFAAKAHKNAASLTSGNLQTDGGTKWDLPVRNGRDPSKELKISQNAYSDVETTALGRASSLFAYHPQHPSVIKRFIPAVAKTGLNAIQNFHGQNDRKFTDPVDEQIVATAEETGLKFRSIATASIEDNINYDEDKIIDFLRHRLSKGCKGIYLKSASGRVNPDKTRDLVERVMREFPDQEVGMHAHDTYGEAIPYYIAGAEAAAKMGKSIRLDGLHSALAGNTAQASMEDIRIAFLNHPDPKIQAMAPEFNQEAHDADDTALLEMRARWGATTEAKFDPETTDLSYEIRAPGGADAALKKMAANTQVLSKYDWESFVKKAVFKMQKKIDAPLGEEIQITPFAKNKNAQALMSLEILVSQSKSDLEGKTSVQQLQVIEAKIKDLDAVSFLKLMIHEDTLRYINGELGDVPESMDPEIIEYALNKNLKPLEPVSYNEAKQMLVDVEILPPEALQDIFDPTDEQEWQILQTATLWEPGNRKRGLNHVKGILEGTIKEAAIPDFPEHLQGSVIDAIGGPAEIERIGLHSQDIARAEYFIARMGRLQIDHEDEKIAGKDFYTKFRKEKIERSLEGIVLSTKAMLADLREEYPQDKQFARAVTVLNTAIKTHCQSKGVTEDANIPKITPVLLKEFGLETRIEHAQSEKDALIERHA